MSLNPDSSCKETRRALVVEGGAMRGIFSAGVLDRFMDLDFNPFDFCIGVSAGATNLAAWMCRQRGRNYKVYTDYSCRPPFISFRKYLFGGHALDLDWLWEKTISELRLDLDTFEKQKIPFYIASTNSLTGNAEYFKAEAKTLEQVIKASSALPVLYRGFPLVDNTPMSDGGIADPIPVEKAYGMGAKQITVILSRPSGYRKKSSRFSFLNSMMLKDKKSLASAMNKRSSVYNRSIDFIENPPSDCSVNIIAPPEDFNVGRMTKDREKLDGGYRMGLEAAEIHCERFLNC